MATSIINRLISLLSRALEALSARVPIAEVESMAMLIHQSMDQGHRTYHTTTHVFEMCEGMNPRQVLATLFHDIVYYQLDGGFPQHAYTMLMRAIRDERHELMIRAIDDGDTGLAICAGIFGFKPGETLPLYAGMNEFLSAIVAIRLLEPYLPARDLVAIASCIEATIPFRSAGPDGRGPYENLAGRLRALGTAQGIAIPQAEIDRMVTDAVVLANQDVASFAEEDPGNFLSTTWQLIEESNAPLAAVGIYSIQDYRSALVRMETFLSTLDPDHVFHQYQNTPPADRLAALRLGARKNLEFAAEYLGVKIVGIAVVEAIALAAGGNGPVSMFLGDMRSAYGKPDRAEDFLPPPPNVEIVDQRLVAVLEKGRARESNSDLTSSPITAFVYRYLGHQGARHALQKAKQMFAGELVARDFLAGLNPQMVRALIGACARIALSRRELLAALKKSF